MRLQGKVALVTGGARRIGRAIALGLAGCGCHVAITYRTSAAEARQAVRQIRRRGRRAMALEVDQRDPAQVRRVVEQVRRAFGRLDILVNSASSFPRTPWATVTGKQWEDVLSVNLSGPWAFSQSAGRIMLRQGSGRIIQIVDAAVYRPWADYLPYCAAKGGLLALTWGLARALAPRVQVNAIAPGPILFAPGTSPSQKRAAVEKTLLKRAGGAEEVVRAVLFLAESDFVTGVVLPVDGGRLLA